MFGFFFRNSGGQLPQLFWHTDIHSHVCPGIDDGSPSPQTSVRLVSQMADLGFTRMIVTPHVTDETFPNTPAIISRSYMALREACAKAGLTMRFGCSAEYRIDELLMDMLEKGIVTPLPGNCLLVENAWYQEPFGLDEFLYNLQNEYGYTPIMAHPERFPYYHNHLDRLQELHASGAYLQVNLLSLAGHYGRTIKQTAEWLLAHDLVSFVGSDLHRERHLESIRNYLRSKDYRKLEAKAHLILNDRLDLEATAAEKSATAQPAGAEARQ